MLTANRNPEPDNTTEDVFTFDQKDRTDQNKAKIRDTNWFCRLCHHPVRPAMGKHQIWHFKHKPGSDCPWFAWSEPESLAHLSLKHSAASAMRHIYKNANVELEVILREAERIADVLVTTTDNDLIAVECQLSAITQEQLEIRTIAYERTGYDIIWVFESRRMQVHNKLFPGFYEWLQQRGNTVILAEATYTETTVELGVFGHDS